MDEIDHMAIIIERVKEDKQKEDNLLKTADLGRRGEHVFVRPRALLHQPRAPVFQGEVGLAGLGADAVLSAVKMLSSVQWVRGRRWDMLDSKESMMSRSNGW